jgi:hypothetical protein|tara:strand:- start:418 stop:669 length:252 start_codon:yes stop_codon:yes gene_type:complete
MMDIYCKHCGEPWDAYELHDMYDANDNKLPYTKAAKQFAALGCGAFTILDKPKKCTNGMVDPDAALRAKVYQELSEHPDDWLD